jgi:hypothetical protein
LRDAGAENVEVREKAFQMGKHAAIAELQEISTWNLLILIENFSYVCESQSSTLTSTLFQDKEKANLEIN